MNIGPWKDTNDDVSGGATSRHQEVEAEEAVTVATSGKTVNTKMSSSSWMKSKDPRIVRVSRAFGGKDRHSKVCTLRGLRDRRVRLSVPTAIQLYDLQERLGVDQPSKAVDWLLDVAKDEIDELPPLPISPETFSLFNHHQSFLNLGQRPGQDPTQIGFKTNGCVEDCEENNKEKGENDAVFANNHHHHIGGSYGTYHHQQHSNFQGDYNHHHHHHHHQHHQLHSLVPFPSQILVCPMATTTTTTTTIQSFFPPSSSSSIDPRQMVNHFQMPLMGNNSSSSSSQNISTLYSLLHGGSSSNNGGSNISPSQFNRANKTGTTRLLGSDSSPSRGSDQQM